eukprot:356105-Chlamydomonas_euryale.AAC.3
MATDVVSSCNGVGRATGVVVVCICGVEWSGLCRATLSSKRPGSTVDPGLGLVESCSWHWL